MGSLPHQNETNKILANDDENVPTEPPPSYDEIIDTPPSLTIPPLNLDRIPGLPQDSTVTRDQCVVHLKFLAALADLRDSISADDGLFGIHDAVANDYPDRRNETLARIREKRWAVYTTKAVERYSIWWQKCLPNFGSRPTLEVLQHSSYNSITELSTRIVWHQESMPPLDVLMVWHAHMLNPRSFLEDCIRYGKMSFWATDFPWAVINSCLDSQSLEYNAGDAARGFFEGLTGLAWDNLHDSPRKDVSCPNCKALVHVQWTAGHIPYRSAVPFEKYYGFADKSLNVTCRNCRFIITSEKLKVAKFRRDLKELLEQDLPMPGTFYNVKGIPKELANTPSLSSSLFPNRFLKIVGKDMLSIMRPVTRRCESMNQLREELEDKLFDESVLRQVHGLLRLNPTRDEKVAFRRMMSRYWDNMSIFSMDLVGAVIRQGTFVQKMDSIDWLHSPAVMATMDRLIRKYEHFFYIMVSNPRHMAVPTLDVDLAWHTHQLSPSRYFQYSIHKSKFFSRDSVFIDHDDKVDENKLSDGFEWTSKVYKKLSDGQIYSECTCWYCEAIRAPDLNSRSIFVSSSTSRARDNAATLHDRTDISSNPNKNAHISAHNAVTPDSAEGTRSTLRRLKALRLQSNYERACRRAEKRKSNVSATKGKRRSTDDTSSTYASYPMVWGVPVYVPYYAPYMCDPGVHSDAYAGNPACMSFVAGAHGNCVAGTCGGAVAAGGCGGMSGGTCSGGCAGGGSGSGGCGGGGGGGPGGCGGGGGGGGCGGGGGGGGGCGGGGGGGGC